MAVEECEMRADSEKSIVRDCSYYLCTTPSVASNAVVGGDRVVFGYLRFKLGHRRVDQYSRLLRKISCSTLNWIF